MNYDNMPLCIKDLVDYLVQQLHFRCVQELEDSGFGNRLLVLAGPSNIKVRLVRDRSQWFIEVARKTAEDAWYGLWLIGRLIGTKAGIEKRTEPMPVTDCEQAYLLREHYDLVDSLFGEAAVAETELHLAQMLYGP